MSKGNYRAPLLALALVFGLAFASGGVWAMASHRTQRDGQTAVTPVETTSYTEARRDVPRSASPDDALSDALKGLDRDLFADIRVTGAPAGSVRGAYWLSATLNDTEAPIPMSVWEADLAVGATAERLADDNQDNVASIIGESTFSATDEATSPDKLGGGVGDITLRQAFGSTTSTDAQIIDRAISVLKSFGVSGANVRVLRPLDAALSVRVTLPSNLDGSFPMAALDIALLGAPRQYEGIYLEIDQPSGEPIAIAATAFRIGSGRQWISPSYSKLIDGYPQGNEGH